MPAFKVLADAEAVAAVAIRNAAISGLDDRVYSSIPATPTYPLVVVRRIGGLPVVRQVLDGAIIEVAVWGQSKSQAHDIAQLARIELLELEGQQITSPVDAFVTAVDDAQGMTWDPDRSTGKDRYTFAVRLFMRSD